jgi:glycosyltransferase involved in cell wall biosynthesis
VSMDVSVVIPTYNREQYLTKCLDCLFDQDYPSDRYEIVVVDDASTDGTEAMVRAKDAPCRLKYLRQNKGMGCGPAKNKGIFAAEGRIVIFIDSDAFAPPWYVREHVESHMAHPHVIVDGPAISFGAGQGVPAPLFDAANIRALAFLGFSGQQFVNVNASCPREDLLKVHGFDEAFIGWEDLELAQRLRDLGLGRIRNRRAFVLHCEAGNKSLMDAAARMKHNGKYAAMFYRKHPSPWARKKTRLRYLEYDRMFERFGWPERYLTQESLSKSQRTTGPWFALLRWMYLIHSYAVGLAMGFAEQGMESRNA